MPATGNEVVKLSQLKTYADSVTADIEAKQDALDLPLSVENGGTGATTASDALTSLGAASTDDLADKLDAPTSAGTSGQVLTWNGTTTEWTTIETGQTYTGTSPINVTGTVISVDEAGEGAQGTVEFASDSDFATYMGIS